MGSEYCSDAACGGFYHCAFFKREVCRERDYCSSRDVVLWDAEVFGEAARVDVRLLELVAECIVSAGTSWPSIFSKSVPQMPLASIRTRMSPVASFGIGISLIVTLFGASRKHASIDVSLPRL